MSRGASQAIARQTRQARRQGDQPGYVWASQSGRLQASQLCPLWIGAQARRLAAGYVPGDAARQTPKSSKKRKRERGAGGQEAGDREVEPEARAEIGGLMPHDGIHGRGLMPLAGTNDGSLMPHKGPLVPNKGPLMPDDRTNDGPLMPDDGSLMPHDRINDGRLMPHDRTDQVMDTVINEHSKEIDFTASSSKEFDFDLSSSNGVARHLGPHCWNLGRVAIALAGPTPAPGQAGGARQAGRRTHRSARRAVRIF